MLFESVLNIPEKSPTISDKYLEFTPLLSNLRPRFQAAHRIGDTILTGWCLMFWRHKPILNSHLQVISRKERI